MRVSYLLSHLIIILVFLTLAGCNQKPSDVQIKTSGIFIPLTFGIDDQDASGKFLDMGEWVTSDGPKTLTVKVQNNTFFPYADIDLKFTSVDPELTSSIRFKPNNQGDSVFPGAGGTCQRSLGPGLNCTIIIEFFPLADGKYQEQLDLTFKNWVESESHFANLSFVSGEPAELVFVGTPSKIPFGARVGSTYIIERTVSKTYDLKDSMFSSLVPKGFIEVKNVGGLAARDIYAEFEHKCSDTFGSICVDDATYGKAFSYILTPANCGVKLEPGSTCRIELFYNPKNNAETGLSPRFERIKYEADLSLKYVRRPDGQRQTLGLSMESVSSKIEGFLASNSLLDLSNSGIGVIQGNEIAKKIRVENIGFAKLRLKKLVLTKSQMTGSQDEVWGICEKVSTSSPYMHCYKPNSNLLFTNLVSQFELLGTQPARTLVTGPAASSYEALPFIVEDIGQGLPNDPGCFAPEAGPTKAPLIDISGGCFLNIIFRPTTKTFFSENANQNSVSALDAADSTYSIFNKAIKAFVLYDSQWKYGEDHCQVSPDSDQCPDGLLKTKWYRTDFSFEILAKRRAAAKLVVQDVTYNVIATDLINDIWTQSLNSDWSFARSYQLRPEGRIELLAYNQRNRSQLFKNISITLSNIGGTKAILESPLDTALGISWAGKGAQTFSFDGQSVLSNLQDANNCLNTGKNECFYRNLSTGSADCRKIEVGATCILTISYAPFSLGDALLQGKANFDDYPVGAVPSWSQLNSYNQGDYVTYNGLIYKAIRTHGISAVFNAQDWEPLFKSFTIQYRNSLHKTDTDPVFTLSDWVQLKQYQVNDEVIFDGIRFKSLQNHTSGVSFDPSKWEMNNSSRSTTNIKIRSKMISVGKLEEMADNFYNDKLRSITTPLVKPAEMTFKYWFTNIGAGQVAHINLAGVNGYLNGPPECGVDTTEGGTGGMSGKDCRCYSLSTPLTPLSTSCTSGAAANDILASEQSCYLPIRWNLWLDSSPLFPVQNLIHTTSDSLLVNYVVAPELPSSKSIVSSLSYKNCYTKSDSETALNYDSSWGYQLTQANFTSLLTVLRQPAFLVPAIQYTPTSAWHSMGMGRRMGSFTKPDTTQNSFDPRFFYWDTSSSTRWSLSHGSGSQVANAAHNANHLLHSIVGSVNYFNPALKTGTAAYDSINDSIQEAIDDDGAISYYLFLGKYAKYSQINPAAKIITPFSLANQSSTIGVVRTIEVGDIPNTLGATSLAVKQGTTVVQSTSTYDLAIPSAQLYTAEIDPTHCVSGVCVYAKYLDFTYDTGLNHKDWNGSTFVNSTTRPENDEKKIRVVLIAEVDSGTTQPVLIDHGDYQGATANVCPQIFNPFTVNPRDWNQSAGQSFFTEMILRTERNVRIQKAIKFRNNSNKTIRLSNIMMRFAANSGNTALVTASDLTFWGISVLPDATDGAGCNYTRCNVNTVLAPNQECYNIIRFHPTRDTVGGGINYYLTYLIKENSGTSDKSHELLNLPLNVGTISPARLNLANVTFPAGTGTVLASNLSPYFQNNSGWNLSQNPFRFSLPDYTFQSNVINPKTTRYFRVGYAATTDAKSSFLAQYRDFVGSTTSIPHPTNDFVEDTSTSDGTGSLFYTLIWEKNLNSTNHQLMKVFASRQCIYGNNPPVPDGNGVVVDNGSGFDRFETNCWLRVEITHNHKNLLHQTHFGNSANAALSTITPYLAQLRFFSVSRTSIASMSLVADFRSRPKVINLGSKLWSAITAIHTGGASVNNTTLTAQITPDQTTDDINNFGQIVGYRLVRSNSAANLSGSLYQGSGTALLAPRIFSQAPAKPSGLNNNIFATEDNLSSVTNPAISFNNAQANRVYHYKLMAIVSHPDFNTGISRFSLSSNNYFLAETDLVVARVITPNNSYFYNHKAKALIQNFDVVKFSNVSNKRSFTEARGQCTVIGLTLYQDTAPTSFSRSNQLINPTVYNLFQESELGVDYWVDTGSAISFNDALCGGFTDPIPVSNSLMCRKAINSEALSGRLLIGNLSSRGLYPYATVGEYILEDSTTLRDGFSRCFIDLNTLVSPNLP
jgi:hypothetical protein